VLGGRIRERLAVGPRQYRLVADVTLLALSLIVLTGAAVRLTNSGLGCPYWPKCDSKLLPPLATHALIEFGNRTLTGVVGILAIAVIVLAFTRRPRRKDLLWLSAIPLVGVFAQALLGGAVVEQNLAPGTVMAHFGLSMVLLIGCVWLAWRARYEPGERPRASDRVGVWAVRALAPLGAVTIFAGTVATGAGPHSGGSAGQRIDRLHFEGSDTLTWAIHQHATLGALLGCAVIGAWFLRRQRGATSKQLEPLVTLGVLLAAQGLVGSVQYELHLPADMVWVHVALATATWVTLLWTVAAAGSLAPSTSKRDAEADSALMRGEGGVEGGRETALAGL
jgi:cytochrome c oxidase assembly protein subunit 15